MSDAELPDAEPPGDGDRETVPVTGAGQGESTGLDTNVAAALTYGLGAITGIIFLLIEKKDQEVRWNAGQSVALTAVLIVVSIALSILGMIPIIGILAWLLSIAVSLGAFVLWIVLLLRTYQGNRVTLPVVGNYAQKVADTIK